MVLYSVYFLLYAKRNNKKFVLIIHPWARNLDNNIGKKYNQIDNTLLSKINRDIDYLLISDDLKKFENTNSDVKIFHKYDGHYTKEGYAEVSNIIFKYLNKILKKGNL